jgi:hypothetical protein
MTALRSRNFSAASATISIMGRDEDWAQLFTCDAMLSIGDLAPLGGRQAIASLPGKVVQLGGGFWRHQIVNMMVERTPTGKEFKVGAYCQLTDWSRGGAPVASFDLCATLHKRGHWQFARMTLRPVGQPEMPVWLHGEAARAASASLPH